MLVTNDIEILVQLFSIKKRIDLAFAYSLTQSCKLCNVNTYDYRDDLLTNACNPSRTLDNFMSHLWRKQP